MVHGKMVNKKLFRSILLGLSVTLVVAYLVVGIVLPHTHSDERVCEQLQIVPADTMQAYFVSDTELVNMLRAKGIYPVGKPMNQVHLDAIEKTILSHPMIRTAECYRQTGPSVVVRTTRRVPALRVVTSYETYWIDTERNKMPFLPNTPAHVLTVTGNVGERLAQKDLFDLVAWIGDQRFWRQRISYIEVRRPNDIRLHQTDSLTICLGNASGYEKKMSHVHSWYKNGCDTLNAEPYNELDVRFRNQVVARHTK